MLAFMVLRKVECSFWVFEDLDGGALGALLLPSFALVFSSRPKCRQKWQLKLPPSFLVAGLDGVPHLPPGLRFLQHLFLRGLGGPWPWVVGAFEPFETDTAVAGARSDAASWTIELRAVVD
jgi:hypothetical protein